MERIKALLIEEIIFVVFMIITGLVCMNSINVKDEVLLAMIFLGVFVAVGKAVEMIVDDTLCRGYESKGFLRKILRMLICFVLISLCCFSILFVIFINEPLGYLTVFFYVISASFTISHLFISTTIDKTINCLDYQDDDSIFETGPDSSDD